MAARLEYDVPPAPFPGAREEFADLIETLHASGTLRVLNGFFGRLGAVSDVALTELNSPPGRDLAGTLFALGELLAKVPIADVQRVAEGATTGLERAKATLREKPPSTFALLRLMREPDTRRAIAAGLVLFNALGAALARESAAPRQAES